MSSLTAGHVNQQLVNRGSEGGLSRAGLIARACFPAGCSQPAAASRLFNEPTVLRLCRACSLGPLNVVWSTKIQSAIINRKSPRARLNYFRKKITRTELNTQPLCTDVVHPNRTQGSVTENWAFQRGMVRRISVDFLKVNEF